ncbi:MAG: hypothetical protein GY850_38640 [bacterium]|nr:hypothetical protein [bacterium]
MVDPKDIDTLSTELDNRLDDLFGENDVPLLDAQVKEHYPLAELKNLILSIDWEITDEVLEKLIQQLKNLQLMYKHDKIVMSFLQILNSLGNYIKTHRAKAHPKTFKILNSVFSNLDNIVLSGEMSKSAKKKILHAEMQRYKELRNQIAKGKKTAAQPRTKAKARVTEGIEIPGKNEELVIKLDEPSEDIIVKKGYAEPVLTLDEPSGKLPALSLEPEPNTPPATLAEAVEEVKRYIHIEIQALKAEIHSLKEQKGYSA